MIEVAAIPAFDDNYIWAIGAERGGSVALVDPGDPLPVLAVMEERGWQLSAILLTHHHHDHTGGVADLVHRYPVPVYGPAHETICTITHPLREGDRVHLDELGLTLEVFDTPGHTLGHIVYYGGGALFCGDTLFTGGCGRIFEGTAAQLYQSLEKIRALPADTLVYCAHEYTADNLRFAQIAEPESRAISTRRATVATRRAEQQPTVPARLAEELQTNPFLRCHLPVLQQAAEAFCGHPLPTAPLVFATVRQWKDSLD